MAQKPPIRIEALNATAANAATCIFLHGFGDDAEGWTNIAVQFHAAGKMTHMSWIFPNAPYSHDFGTTSWFNPRSFSALPVGKSTNAASNSNSSDEDEDEDQEGILKSVEYVCNLIDAEIANRVDPKRIVVGGFSQGCCISLVTGLGSRYGGRIAGVVGLSGAMPKGKKIKREKEGYFAIADRRGHKMKAFLGHGSKDSLVPLRVFRETTESVEKVLGEDMVAKTYEGMGHQTCGPELRDVCEFLEGVLPA